MPLVMTEFWAHLVSAASITLLLVVAHRLIVATDPTTDRTVSGFRRRGVKALVIGADGRASTSKLQVLLWTFAVLYALTFLLIWGRSVGCGGEERSDPVCQGAITTRSALDRLVEAPLDTEYYALLGLPTAAAIAAKAMTQSKVGSGRMTKDTIDADIERRGNQRDKGSGVIKGVAEIVTNDRGETDLIDFQYLAFNLVALGYFTLEFVDSPSAGLPEIPPTLLALSGVAVAAYSGKKALEKDTPPVITTVLPRRVPLTPGASITVTGSGFGQRDKELDADAKVLLAGVPIKVDHWSETRIRATLGAGSLEVLRSLSTADVAVMLRGGVASAPYPIELVRSGDGE